MPPSPPPPPPPSASEITWGGDYQLATSALIQAMRGRMQPRHGDIAESRNWRLPPDAAFPAVRAYYAGALKGWSPVANFPARLADAETAAWEAPGEAFAVGLVDGPPGAGEPRKVLVVFKFER